MPTPSTSPSLVPTRPVSGACPRPSGLRWSRRVAVVLAVPVALALGLTPSATAAGGDNTVVAVNASLSAQPVHRFSWDLERTTGAGVAAHNAAVAVSVGRGARTTAMAWQIVLASRTGLDVDAENMARTEGSDCLSCDTTAIAYQFVVASDADIDFSPRTQARLAELRDRAAALGWSAEPSRSVTARADAIAGEVRDVLAAASGPRAGSRSARSAPPGVVVRRMVDHH